MSIPRPNRFLPLCAALLCAGGASAHVTLPPGGATAGSDYEAAFRVGHACKDAQATTGITVRLPEGFTLAGAQPRAGWTLSTKAQEVSWTADSAQTALQGKEHGEFVLRGKLTDKPGTLWFKVLQSCDKGSADWAQIPAADTAQKPEFPAARLDVLAPGVAPVDVRDAWVRQAVPGQSGTGAFMKLTAPSGARLIGVSTPVAGIAEVHEMKMDGDVMRMRALPDGLALPPRQTVALAPGGYHIMLMQLKQPITKGASVPLSLQFEDAQGRKSALELKVPVGAPDGAAAGAAHGHMH
ncbi:copper chaperone PCu(A)C [Xylophilus sp. ASV27]|uniref:copper chaperone PCu(A)C n=1 Tax=Xylophilus sp. ASV27 TaxID=2795129 RepID=UPI0018EC7BCA|nr:copper chaperone PCu(A)C [Xylophilus sp. ASV27]